MWLDNLKELRKSAGMSLHQLAEVTKIPESTVKRIFSGETDNPYVDTIRRLAAALDASLDDIFAESKAVVATERLVDVKESAGVIEAERDLIAAENALLKDKVAALTAEVAMLEREIKHKDELLAVHNFYSKLIPHT